MEQLKLFDWPKVQQISLPGSHSTLIFTTKNEHITIHTSTRETSDKIKEQMMKDWYEQQEIF